MTREIEYAQPELCTATYKGAKVDQSGTENRLFFQFGIFIYREWTCQNSARTALTDSQSKAICEKISQFC
jgi:hypothetical protein